MFTAAIKTMTRILLAIGVTALIAMMFLTAFDVVMRYIFNQPVRGALEVVEYLMAVFVSFSIAWCADQKGHVAVDLVMGRFPLRVQAFFNLITTIVTMLFVSLITWQNILFIKDVYASKLTSAVLRIPVYPFSVTIALGFGLFSLILLIHTFELLSEVRKK